MNNQTNSETNTPENNKINLPSNLRPSKERNYLCDEDLRESQNKLSGSKLHKRKANSKRVKLLPMGNRKILPWNELRKKWKKLISSLERWGYNGQPLLAIKTTIFSPTGEVETYLADGQHRVTIFDYYGIDCWYTVYDGEVFDSFEKIVEFVSTQNNTANVWNTRDFIQIYADNVTNQYSTYYSSLMSLLDDPKYSWVIGKKPDTVAGILAGYNGKIGGLVSGGKFTIRENERKNLIHTLDFINAFKVAHLVGNDKHTGTDIKFKPISNTTLSWLNFRLNNDENFINQFNKFVHRGYQTKYCFDNPYQEFNINDVKFYIEAEEAKIAELLSETEVQ